jgi:hypothetical protein
VITLLSRLLGPLPTEAGKKEKERERSESFRNTFKYNIRTSKKYMKER